MIKTRNNLLLIGIVLLGSLLRLFYLRDRGLVLYEDLFARLSVNPIGSIPNILKTFPHHPFYFFLLHFWLLLFGNSAFLMKLPSVIFNIISIIFIYFFGRKVLGSNKIGLWGAFLFAVSPINIYWSLFISPYSLLVFLSLASSTFFCLLLMSNRLRYKILYLFFTSLLLYTHICGLVILLMQNLFFVFYRKKKFSTKQWFIIQLILLFVYLPWLILFCRYQIYGYASAPGLVCFPRTDPPLPTPADVLTVFKNFSYSNLFLLILFVAIIILGLVKTRKRTPNFNLFMIIWIIFPHCLLYIISTVILPVYKPYAVLFTCIPFYLLTAQGLIYTYRYIQTALILVVFLVTVNILHNPCRMNTNGGWGEILKRIHKMRLEGDIVIIYPGTDAGGLEYYKETAYPVNNLDELKYVLEQNGQPSRYFLLFQDNAGLDKSPIEWCKQEYLLLDEYNNDSECGGEYGLPDVVRFYLFLKKSKK